MSEISKVLILELFDALLQHSRRNVFPAVEGQLRLEPSLLLHVPLHLKLLPLQLD